MSNFLNQYFATQAGMLTGEIAKTHRIRGRLSALMRKETLPRGQGMNFSNLIFERSTASGGAGWVDMITPNGTQNNCTPSPSTILPASTTKTYAPQKKVIRSHKICFADAAASYLWDEEVANTKKNLVEEVVDTWEERDTAAYVANAKHKMICNESFSESPTAFPATAPTRYLDLKFLAKIYVNLLQDGAGEGQEFPMIRGAPQIPLMLSSEQYENVVGRDTVTRQTFEYAEMGKGEDSTLLSQWAADRALGNFLYVINNRMPRYDLIGGVWTLRPYYSDPTTENATTIGYAAEVAHNYNNANYELVIPWHPDVAIRMTPEPIGSLGSGATGRAVNFNGTVIWVNALNVDLSSDEYNPFEDQGRFYAPLVAAYKAKQPRYGYAIMVKRCNGLASQAACY